MPYKDPERKRQWEREHRDERNARRRRSSSNNLPEPSAVDAPLPDRNSAQVPLSSVSFATGVMGLALLLTVLFFLRRLGSARAGPVASTRP
jgi:hypothetical protein